MSRMVKACYHLLFRKGYALNASESEDVDGAWAYFGCSVDMACGYPQPLDPASLGLSQGDISNLLLPTTCPVNNGNGGGGGGAAPPPPATKSPNTDGK